MRIFRAQRLQIACNRRDIGLAQVLQAVFHHVGHATKSSGLIVAAITQELTQVLFAPATQSIAVVTTQIAGGPAINRCAATRQIVAALIVGQRLLLHRDAARRVTGPAVTQSFNQIATTRQHRIFLGCRLERFHVGRKNPAPDRQRPAHRQRPGNVALAVWLPDRRDAMHEVGVKRLHVFIADHCV